MSEQSGQQKLPQNPPIGSNDTNITSNKLFIFPNIVSISADQVTQRSLPELFVRDDNQRNLSGVWNVVKQIELKVGQMYTIVSKALLQRLDDKICDDKTNGEEAPGED